MAKAKKARSSKRSRETVVLIHPVAGASTAVPKYLAIFWRECVDGDAREAILKDHGLELASIKFD